MHDDDARIFRLNKLFKSIIHGQTSIAGNRANATHFLEALCVQPEPVACVHEIVTAKAGLASLQGAIFMQSSVQIFNDIAGLDVSSATPISRCPWWSDAAPSLAENCRTLHILGGFF